MKTRIGSRAVRCRKGGRDGDRTDSKRENRHQHGRGDERRENNENKEMEKGETAMGYRLETEDKQDGTGEQDRSHTSM